MAFTLKAVRSGQLKTFSAKEILELIGDRINDEIIIRDEVYRISSCVDFSLGGGGGGSTAGSIDWVTLELTMAANGETVFYNPEVISDTDSVFLTVNSVLYQYGVDRDFHIVLARRLRFRDERSRCTPIPKTHPNILKSIQ
jgi:hypothetical protein